MLYGCTAISRKLEELAIKDLEALAQEDLMASDLVFQDPYLLDFLGLKDTLSERDPESANSPEAGEVPAGSGQRLRLRSQAKAHDHRRPKVNQNPKD